jgi:hypothetical protein
LPALVVNGLTMPPDFPAGSFERAYSRVNRRAAKGTAQIENFNAAWNAVSMRFLSLEREGNSFIQCLRAHGGAPNPHQRHDQEHHLFSFFSNGFAVFEAFFYGMFTVGAILLPAEFPMTTAKDQQSISPTSADRAYRRAFVADPIVGVFTAVFGDPSYRELREVRNILTHRTAPGRRIYVGIGSDEELPAVWKINAIPLDENLSTSRRREAARLLTQLLDASATFIESKT